MLKDIKFEDVDAYVHSGQPLNMDDFPMLTANGYDMTLSNITTARFGRGPIFPVGVRCREPITPSDNDFYQLHFDMSGGNKKLGDVTVELKKGEGTVFVTGRKFDQPRPYKDCVEVPSDGKLLDAVNASLARVESRIVFGVHTSKLAAGDKFTAQSIGAV